MLITFNILSSHIFNLICMHLAKTTSQNVVWKTYQWENEKLSIVVMIFDFALSSTNSYLNKSKMSSSMTNKSKQSKITNMETTCLSDGIVDYLFVRKRSQEKLFSTLFKKNKFSGDLCNVIVVLELTLCN